MTKINKWTPLYEPKHYRVYKIKGATICAGRLMEVKYVVIQYGSKM